MFVAANTTSSHSSGTILIGLTVLALISGIISISCGSVHFSTHQLYQAIFSAHQTIAHKIVVDLRLPRTLCAFATGGLLALAGVLMQTLLRNPLADPYVLGISGGTAVANLCAILVGLTATYSTLFAFIGSLITMLLVVGLANTKQGFSSLRLLLTGIAIATGFGALISFILTISPQNNLRSMLFWLMGDLNYAQFHLWQGIILFSGLIISFVLAKPMNLLARGDIIAKSLGLHTARLNLILYVLTSLLTAAAVSIAGCIGFVGLIVPHMLRLIGTADHRFLLPASVLSGGILLTLADTIARSALAPIQLPVGIVTAIIGVPIFLCLLKRHHVNH